MCVCVSQVCVRAPARDVGRLRGDEADAVEGRVLREVVEQRAPRLVLLCNVTVKR